MFGICLGMQCAVVEFARNVLNLDASSTEVDSNPTHPVIDLMEEQKEISQKGGTMRLGSYDCQLDPTSKTAEAYGVLEIKERHRHRYEFNNNYLDKINEAGLISVGMNTAQNLVEIVELADHPWFIGVQFHPELKSRVEQPHPLFVSFVKACIAFKEKK
jgi:CTP synthase